LGILFLSLSLRLKKIQKTEELASLEKGADYKKDTGARNKND